jgi:hypothetical protein
MKGNKKNAIPANEGLQRFSSGINEKYSSPSFETLAATSAEPQDIADAKEWVDENRL